MRSVDMTSDDSDNNSGSVQTRRVPPRFVPVTGEYASVSSLSIAGNELDDDLHSETSLLTSFDDSALSRPCHYAGVDDAAESPLPRQQQILQHKARLVRDLADKSRRETQREAETMREQQTRTLAAYLDELRRRYESKKNMALLTLREQYERETKAAVRSAMEKHEQEQQDAVETLRISLVATRKQTLQTLRETHEKQTADLLSRLETKLKTETLHEQQAVEKQLQFERDERIKAMESVHRNAMAQWEADKKLALEQEAFSRREEAAAMALKEQEAKTLELMREMERTHGQNELEKLQKLRKVLAFGAQAQLQQLRRRLQIEHDEKASSIKAEAALELEQKTDELTQLLTVSHRAQQEKLQRDLETKHRVAIMDLQDRMQRQHEAQVEVLNANAAKAREEAVREHQKQLEMASREVLDALEASLERESSAKIRQMEVESEAECAQSLETLRRHVVQTHANELEAKVSRMQQCRCVLLAEAKELLAFAPDKSQDRSESVSCDADMSEAVANLTRLRKHLSSELAKYVGVVVDEFLDMAEEQRILVAKITDATQLYLAFKRQCAALEERAAEWEREALKLQEQVRRKDVVCKKLYLANEALMSRLPQTGKKLSKEAATKSDRLSSSRPSK